MRRFSDLGIRSKFNIIMIVSMAGLFIFASAYNYLRSGDLIVKGAVDNARIIARQIVQTREYMSDVVKGEPGRNYNLVPQVVATQVAKRITERSSYYVRQVSLRYRNPENRPDSFETAQLEKFKVGQQLETFNVIDALKGKELRYMLAMRAEKSCLECHGTFERAPAFVQERFPRGHFSYNYREGEIIGAVSVTIPMESLFRDISTNLNMDILLRAVMFILILFLMGILINRTIIDPIRLVSGSITRAARTGAFSERISVQRKDEVGQLIIAFNEMMGELERKIEQSRESEDRYRTFIKMAQSAVVTFMEDGKIVITNERAEKLLGISRTDLLGEILFDFLEEGSSLQKTITDFLAAGKTGVITDRATARIRNASGLYITVEVAISASRTDGSIMLTGIFREAKT